MKRGGRCRPGWLRAGWLGAALLAAASAALAQRPAAAPVAQPTRQRPKEFGTQDYTVTVIHASSFTADGYYDTDFGSLTRHFPYGSGGHYFSGVEIPAGAVIDYIGMENAASGAGQLTATLFYVDRYSGTTSGIVVLPNSVHPLAIDYNSYELGWQLTQNAHNALVMDVYQVPNSSPNFGWVEIWWRRTVSPAPAVPSFDDVPTDHPFFQFVEALKASGITGGCQPSPPLYCPDRPLTRGQMAVFLSKALGLHWPDNR
jgi:hypothetical protein